MSDEGREQVEMADLTGDVDVDRPNAARMYDYFLGGTSNLVVDREAADEVMRSWPASRWARDNRAFMGRAVAYLCERGIDQFLDLGSGIPTVGNVHEIAHAHNPAARVAYVDNEPVAVAHGRRLMCDKSQVTVTQADLRDPASVFAAPGVADLLDFDRPIAVLAVAVLHFIPDGDRPADVLAEYRGACVPGSYVVISHGAQTSISDTELDSGRATYRRTATPITSRTREEIAALVAGYTLVEPGLTLLPDWHPTAPVDRAYAEGANAYAAVGYVAE